MQTYLNTKLKDYADQYSTRLTNIYHIVYETPFQSLAIHFWTKCNLSCRGCYARYEPYDFGLLDDPIRKIASTKKEYLSQPNRFLSFGEVMELLSPLDIKNTVFMGTEASLDPNLPYIAKVLHEKFNSRNYLLTNGVKLTDMEDIDEIVVSIKAWSEDTHYDYTGRSNKKVLDNFYKIYKTGKRVQAETVLIPDYIDSKEVERIARYLSSIDPDIKYRIDAYFPVPGCPWRAATNEEVEETARLARKHLTDVTRLTLDMKRIGDKAIRIF